MGGVIGGAVTAEKGLKFKINQNEVIGKGDGGKVVTAKCTS